MEGQTASSLIVGVPRETAPGERRVAMTPDTVKRLTASGVVVKVEVARVWPRDTATTRTSPPVPPSSPTPPRRSMLRSSSKCRSQTPMRLLCSAPATIIALLQPMTNVDLIRDLAARDITAFSMDAIPRTTRAQSMDVLSSQATVAGYKAVLMAADNLPKFFPMLTTAAGSIVPAKVLVVGAGVAGLQAVATARRLGAVVEAYDTARGQGAGRKPGRQVRRYSRRHERRADRRRLRQGGLGGDTAQAAGGPRRPRRQSDVVITTAAVPGRPAPRLISKETVERMRPGSVIVDLAAETGGNVELTRAGETVEHNGVKIMGQVNLPSTMPVHASQMYAKNIQNLLDLLIKNGKLDPDFEDEIVKGTVITRGGDVVHEMTKQRIAEQVSPAQQPAASQDPVSAPDRERPAEQQTRTVPRPASQKTPRPRESRIPQRSKLTRQISGVPLPTRRTYSGYGGQREEMLALDPVSFSCK